MKTLEQVLADWSEDAQVLRRRGDPRAAELIEAFVTEVREAGEDFIRWLTEEEAMNRAGHGREWFRRRRGQWEEQGHAKRDGRKWRYRAVVVPRRVNLEAVRADAKRTAEEAAA